MSMEGKNTFEESNGAENETGSIETGVSLPEYESLFDGAAVGGEDAVTEGESYDPERDAVLPETEQEDLIVAELSRERDVDALEFEVPAGVSQEDALALTEIGQNIELRHEVLNGGDNSPLAVRIAKRQTLEDALAVPESAWLDTLKSKWGRFKKRAHAVTLAGVAAMGVGMETAQARGLGDILPPQERAQAEAQVRQEMGRHAAEMNVGIPSRQRQAERYDQFQRSYNEQINQANLNYQTAVNKLNIWLNNEINRLNASGRQLEIPDAQAEYHQHQQKIQRAYEADVRRIQARAQYSQEEVVHGNRVDQIISGAAGSAIYRIFSQ